MAGRSPARFLAPIALIAFAVRAVLRRPGRPRARRGQELRLVHDRDADEHRDQEEGAGQAQKRKTYTVKSGDTPSGIAEKTGVSLDTLQELNPDLDPQTLAPGQRIRLSE